MRRLQKPPGTERVRKVRREPLAEGIRTGPFSQDELETICRRRAELIDAGLNEKAIAKALSKEIRRTTGSIKQKIHKMVKSGELPENPGRQKVFGFTVADLAAISGERAVLIEEGLTDLAIAKSLSAKLGRSPETICEKIRSLIKSGRLPGNPNKKRVLGFCPRDIVLIRERRSELMAEGLTDLAISAIISGELRHGAAATYSKIRNLVRLKQLPENPNKQRKPYFNADELAFIRQRRAELAVRGLNDLAISELLSRELDRSSRSIEAKIRRLARSGDLPKNPNNLQRLSFTAADIAFISRRRGELMAGGMTDHAMSQVIGGEMQRTAQSICKLICGMAEAGKFPRNPLRQVRSPFTAAELAAIPRKRAELIMAGLTDHEISKGLSGTFQKSAHSIDSKIRSMVDAGELPENPNKPLATEMPPQFLSFICAGRESLIARGQNDAALSKALSESLSLPVEPVYRMVLRLVNSGELPENPNKRGTKPPEAEVLAQLKAAVSLYTETAGND